MRLNIHFYRNIVIVIFPMFGSVGLSLGVEERLIISVYFLLIHRMCLCVAYFSYV